MSPLEICLLIGGIVLGSGLLFGVGFTFYVAWRVYSATLFRPDNEKRERKCSFPSDPEQLLMYNRGLEWADKYAAAKREVSVESEGLKLVGEYYDFGADRAVIIIPGRTESITYSYYFAEPYRANGFNVLVFDSRATGFSDGKYYALGGREYRDVLKWGELLHDKLGNSKVFLHGICIGSATAIYTLTSENCPAYFAGMCADGMYKNFFEIFWLHMKEWNKPAFPIAYEVMVILYKNTGANCLTYGPYKAVKKLKKPILFIYTEKDQYALPEESKKVYANCASPAKEFRWFKNGTHSRVRINDEEGYDSVIKEFVEKHKDVL